jgi:hypothetical protein
MFQGQAFHPFWSFGGALVRSLFFRQHQAIGGMGAFGQGLFSTDLELFQSVLANRLQHHKAGFTPAWLDLLRKTFIDHGCHAIEQIQIKIASGIAHGFRAFQRASAHEHRESPEKLLLGGSQQIVAPVNGGAQRLLPLRHVARAAGQQLQPAGETCPHGRGRKNFDPGGCEFDGERQTIEARANFGDRGCIVWSKFKIRLDRDGPLHEQCDRRILCQDLDSGQRLRIRHGQRRHRKFMLSVHVQRCATGDHDFKIGPRRQQPCHHRCSIDQVFEIIQQEQDVRAGGIF